MKIGCSEVPKPTYPSLLWPAEWKAPAPFLTKNWSCSSESEALLFRWLRERLCPNRSWPRVIRRSGLLKELLTRDSTLCLPGFTRGCRSCTWWSSSATSRTPTSCTSCWSFAGIAFASLLVVYLPHYLEQCEMSKLLVQKDVYKYYLSIEREVWWRRKAVKEPESRYFVH